LIITNEAIKYLTVIYDIIINGDSMKLAIYDFDGTYMKNEILRRAYSFWKFQGLNNRMYRKIWNRILFRRILYKLKLCGWTKARFRVNAMKLTADLFRSVERHVLDNFLINLYYHLLQLALKFLIGILR